MSISGFWFTLIALSSNLSLMNPRTISAVTLLLCFLLPGLRAIAQAPSIVAQPRSQSVSLGADVVFRVTAWGSSPLAFQWLKNQTNLPDATNTTLTLGNAALSDAGQYSVTVTNSSGSVTSQVATLDIDPTFTKITTGQIVTDGGDSSGCAWGDFDNDGFPDLFVGNGGTRNFLYRNNGDGTFTKLTNAVPAMDRGYGASWGDYDNDGQLDLFVANLGANYLYRNNGNGTFTKVTSFAGAVGASSWSGSWGDFNRDGWLDLFICNGGGNNNVLLRNNGDGTFTRITVGRIVSDGGTSIGAAWQDYNNDGWPDLFVANYGGNSFLYRNLRDGTFERITSGPIGTDSQTALVPDWGDYNNDGCPDLAIGAFGHNMLYRNLGDGSFARQTSGPFVLDSQNSEIVQWVDYDNDGFLDLFSANASGQNNTLYRNNGDGTFTKILTGSLVNDGGDSAGCAWADYDNNGFLDLFVANWRGSGPNSLYRNNGNSNHWLKVKCVGSVSNRAAIGAKVRVKATLRNQSMWQLREISGGTGYGQTTPLAHFGLGDASVAETVRVEWPSGAVQEFHQVDANQLFTVIEPPKLEISRNPGTASITVDVIGLPGAKYFVETSEDLANWTESVAVTNVNRRTTILDSVSSSSSRQFYRARNP